MAFHPYPKVIRILFNGRRFGPPAPVTAPSACPGVDRKVSRPPPATRCPLRTRFRSGCGPPGPYPRRRRATRRLIMQKARRHPTKGAPTACGRTVSGSISLRCPRCFSPFPHGTCALSVSRECLALADGAAGFGQGSSDPALLRVPARLAKVTRTGLSPAPARLSRRLPLPSLLPLRRPYNPARASTPAVWAGPLSLAATRGVTLVFLSSDYWDVSVRRVRLPSRGMPCLRTAGCPIRTPTDLGPFAPPRGLSRPAASFVASGSQGILRAP